MSSLYELTNDYQEVMNMLDDEEIDEQAILDTLESIEGDIEYKADGCAKLIKNLNALSKGVDEEIKRLKKRKEHFDNNAENIKNNLTMTMKTVGKTKFTTKLFSFNIQKNGGKRKLTIDVPDINSIPKEYRVEQPDIVNNDKIREYLKEIKHDYCEFAHLEPQGESLRIR